MLRAFRIGAELAIVFPSSIRPIFCDPRSNCIQPFSRVAGSIAIETLTISGEKTTIVVPIAIVLVPFPGSTLLWLLQDNLAVIVIHFVVKHAFYRCDDSITTADFTADIVTRVVPRCELHRISIRVDMVQNCLFANRTVTMGNTYQQFCFFTVE